VNCASIRPKYYRIGTEHDDYEMPVTSGSWNTEWTGFFEECIHIRTLNSRLVACMSLFREFGISDECVHSVFTVFATVFADELRVDIGNIPEAFGEFIAEELGSRGGALQRAPESSRLG
jgi:hypothetical protein